MAVIPPVTWNVSAGVVLGGGARGLIMRGVLRYTDTAPATVLTLGDGGTVRNGEKLYANLQVVRQIQSDWGSEADIGTRCGNAVLNRHRAPASRHLRLLGAVPNLRAAAFRHSATESGVEGLAAVAASTTLAELSFNGLDGITATGRELLLDVQKGFAFVVDTCAVTCDDAATAR